MGGSQGLEGHRSEWNLTASANGLFFSGGGRGGHNILKLALGDHYEILQIYLKCSKLYTLTV